MTNQAAATKPHFGDPRTVEITEPDLSCKCCFCGRHETNSAEWGSMLKLDTIVTHHFCLLFSAKAEQLGQDDEGIQAFMPREIKKEIRRGNRLKCKFCKKKNATIGCVVKKCNYSYHYTCGYENGCLSQFFGQYQSFCPSHRPKQKIPRNVFSDGEDYKTCPICMVDAEMEEAIWPPCCGKQLMHRRCIMHTAKAAGYFFKCPLCNSKEPVFIQAMKANGVYVPEQDASWEMEPNAYGDLTAKYSLCDAAVCLCPGGRESTNWNLVRCSSCGSSATHAKCSGLKINKWRCEGCQVIFQDSGALEAETDDESFVEEEPDEQNMNPNSPSSNGALSEDEEEEEVEIIELSDHSMDAKVTNSNEAKNWTPTPPPSPGGNDQNVIPLPCPSNVTTPKTGSVNHGEKTNEALRPIKQSTEELTNNHNHISTISENVVPSTSKSSTQTVTTNPGYRKDHEGASPASQCSRRRRIRNPNVSIPRHTSIQNEDKEEREAEKQRFEVLQAKLHSISVDRKKKRDLDTLSMLKAIGAPSPADIRRLPPIPKICKTKSTESTTITDILPPMTGVDEDRGPIFNAYTGYSSIHEKTDDPFKYVTNPFSNQATQRREVSLQHKAEQTHTAGFTLSPLGPRSESAVKKSQRLSPSMTTLQERLYHMAYGKDKEQLLKSRESAPTLTNKDHPALNRFERWANEFAAKATPTSTITSENRNSPSIEVIDIDDSDDDKAVESDDIILEKVVPRRATLNSGTAVPNSAITRPKMQSEIKEKQDRPGTLSTENYGGVSSHLSSRVSSTGVASSSADGNLAGSRQKQNPGDIPTGNYGSVGSHQGSRAQRVASFPADGRLAGNYGRYQDQVENANGVPMETGVWDDSYDAQGCTQRRPSPYGPYVTDEDFWPGTNPLHHAHQTNYYENYDSYASFGTPYAFFYPNQPPTSYSANYPNQSHASYYPNQPSTSHASYYPNQPSTSHASYYPNQPSTSHATYQPPNSTGGGHTLPGLFEEAKRKRLD